MAIYVNRKPWWGYLEHDLQESIELSLHLSDRSANWSEKFHDYSFVVFPASKAYEGFLKKLFYDLGLIKKSDYLGKHFRIGKALNPELEKRFKNDGDWVYNKLRDYCGGEELPQKLWKTWKECRNTLFHWFPDEKKAINHNEATEKLLMVVDAIDSVFDVCKVDITKLNAKKK